ncbi:hypothetical protein P7K49_012907, partial [Saguinus oedipus]
RAVRPCWPFPPPGGSVSLDLRSTLTRVVDVSPATCRGAARLHEAWTQFEVEGAADHDTLPNLILLSAPGPQAAVGVPLGTLGGQENVHNRRSRRPAGSSLNSHRGAILNSPWGGDCSPSSHHTKGPPRPAVGHSHRQCSYTVPSHQRDSHKAKHSTSEPNQTL